MDDSADSFACSSDTNDCGSSAFTSDTNDFSNSGFASDTNGYTNSAFTSDTNDNCNFVDNSYVIHTQHESDNTCSSSFPIETSNTSCRLKEHESDNIHCHTYSSSFPSETSDTQCGLKDTDNSSKRDTQNESDGHHQQSAEIRHNSFEKVSKKCIPFHSKENDYNTIDTLNSTEHYRNKENEECVRHKIHNDKYNHNTNVENPKDYKEGKTEEFRCLNKEEICTEEQRNNLQIDQPNINYDTPTSFSQMEILDQGLQQTTEKVETDTTTNLEYNNNKYLKDSKFNFINYGPSQNNLVTDLQKNERFAPHWKQFMAAMGPYIMIFSGGLSCGFSATLLPQLKQEQSVILVNESSPSWIASMAALPMAPGCFIGGWIIEKWGRRYALRVLSIPFFLGWILIATAPNLSLMLIGRFLNGISIGMLAPPMSVFISETSHPKLRGMFLAFLSFSLAVGIFIAHLIGTWVSWNWTAAICSVFPLISAGFLTFVPESPMWLLSKGRFEEASNSFYWLRGNEDEVVTELKGMIDKFKSIDTSSSESWKEKLKTFHSPEFFKPLVIMIIIYVTCQFSGVHTITFYSVTIIEIAVGKGINKYVAMLTIDFLRTLTTLLTIMTSRKFPRRSLCIVSGTLTTISMMSLAIFLYFYKEIPDTLTMVPLCFLSAYIIAINIGLMPLPWIIVGEIFPARVRSFGAGLASAIGYSSTFVVVKTAPGMMVNIGQVATFMFYGSVALGGTAVLYFVLPETKGRSMVEIEALFKRNKIKNNP